MMLINQEALTYYAANYDRFMERLKDLLKIPSISTDPNHKTDIHAAAAFLQEYLEELHFKNVTVFQTTGHPIVYGELISTKENAPTLLIYGHYDVQPADPINEWNSSPFVPTEKEEYLYARGSSDMKGQIMACLFAIESVSKTCEIPVNVKVMFEGEEEIGSPSLDTFIENHRSLLSADVILNPDAGMVSADKPTIVYGLRGLAYFELTINGPKADLHSGQFGGIVHNPAIILSELISAMHDSEGRVTLPGFYDSVRRMSPEEKERIASLNLDDAHYLGLTGVKELYGEAGFSQLERLGARPTLDVNGLYSGFIGEGAKTIIPAFARAKISCRLVPDQDPEEVYNQLVAFLTAHMPSTATWNLIKMSGAPAYIAESAPGVKILTEALETVWGTRVAYKREGGSVPVATAFKHFLGVDSILTGFGLPDDQIHSPNERLHLPTWQKGIKALILFLQGF